MANTPFVVGKGAIVRDRAQCQLLENTLAPQCAVEEMALENG
jgi:hypothetical protein